MVRMSDIASKAGVSRSTVSLVLNNKHASVGIAEDTCHRVLNAARQLGYHPNEVARAMVTGKNRVIVYLVHDPAVEVAARILAGALEEADAHGYSVKVVGGRDEIDEHLIERCIELRPLGVMALYVPAPLNQYLKEEMGRYHIPVLLLDSSFPMVGATRVLTDDVEGVGQALTHLHQLGHRRIACVAGPRSSGAASLREQGYRQGMAQLNLPIPEGYIVHGDWRIDIIQSVTEQLLSLPAEQRPTALFCADDKTALIALRVADQMGIRVPEALSVVGFADLEMARYANPPLTTVAQPFDELGVAAIRNLLLTAKRSESERGEDSEEILLPNRLVIRSSTAPVLSPVA
jgi:LacI family repressor for deo operon, udp, cdd, tsx, nupC, and nupG